MTTPGFSEEDRSTIGKIAAIKDRMGTRLFILTHHYQRKEIVSLGDASGDSFQLSRLASEREGVEHIVFCGVRFMAEAAAVLAKEGQTVWHPNEDAGCPMADMAGEGDVREALLAFSALPGKTLPVVYMNSSVQVKALCGAAGGTICTSSNAQRAMEWALSQADRVLFVPDEHLGRNTAASLGLAEKEVVLWDPDEPQGGLTEEQLSLARVILWRGFCHVHTHFRVEDIEAARRRYPAGTIIVHPECPRPVVERADRAGSTAAIVKLVEGSARGSIIVIGTEINLIDRLAHEHRDRQVVALSRSLCPNMMRITLRNLLETLEIIEAGGEARQVHVPPAMIRDARLALERMLALP